MKTALSTLRAFVGRILRRFVEEDFFQLSAGLAFTTLLALVPLVAVVFGIMSVFPFFLDMAVQIDNFVVRSVLPERSAGVIILHVLKFSQKAGNVTLAGLAALIPTVVFCCWALSELSIVSGGHRKNGPGGSAWGSTSSCWRSGRLPSPL